MTVGEGLVWADSVGEAASEGDGLAADGSTVGEAVAAGVGVGAAVAVGVDADVGGPVRAGVAVGTAWPEHAATTKELITTASRMLLMAAQCDPKANRTQRPMAPL